MSLSGGFCLVKSAGSVHFLQEQALFGKWDQMYVCFDIDLSVTCVFLLQM